MKTLFFAVIAAASPASLAFGRGGAGGIFDASQVSTLLSRASETTSDGCKPDDRWKHRYAGCMLVDPDVADRLVRQAFALEGDTLRDFADGLGVAPDRLAAAIIARMPARPTRGELARILATVEPALSRSI